MLSLALTRLSNAGHPPRVYINKIQGSTVSQGAETDANTNILKLECANCVIVLSNLASSGNNYDTDIHVADTCNLTLVCTICNKLQSDLTHTSLQALMISSN